MCGLTGCASQFFFYPSKTLYGLPSVLGQTFEDVWFESLDGTQLHGWWVEGEGEVHGTVIHFHGNAQNLSAHYAYVDWLPAAGYNVFAFDYRGYGWSEGKPSRSGAVRDSRAALREVLRRTAETGEPVYVLGQSLGGAMALAALSRESHERVCGVAVDSAFSSYRGIVREKMALLPVIKYLRYPLSWLVVVDRYQPLRSAAKLEGLPILFLHGTKDRVVPYHHSEKLYRAAAEPKMLVTIPGGRHTEALGRRREQYANTLLEFFESGN
jgi:alpha-beta hydrolase superfamily lysophospholipase